MISITPSAAKMTELAATSHLQSLSVGAAPRVRTTINATNRDECAANASNAGVCCVSGPLETGHHRRLRTKSYAQRPVSSFTQKALVCVLSSAWRGKTGNQISSFHQAADVKATPQDIAEWQGDAVTAVHVNYPKY